MTDIDNDTEATTRTPRAMAFMAPKWVARIAIGLFFTAIVVMSVCGALSSGVIEALRPERLNVGIVDYYALLRKVGVWALGVWAISAWVLWRTGLMFSSKNNR